MTYGETADKRKDRRLFFRKPDLKQLDRPVEQNHQSVGENI